MEGTEATPEAPSRKKPGGGLRLALQAGRPKAREGEVTGEPFRISLLVSPSGSDADFVPVREVWGDEGGFGSRGRIDATMLLGRAAASWRALRRLLSLDVPDGIDVSVEEIGELLEGAGARLDAMGVGVEWKDGLEPGLTASLVAGGLTERLSSVADSFDGDDPVSLAWQLRFDGEALSEGERELIGSATSGVANMRGMKVLVSPVMRQRAIRPQVRSLPAIEALAAALTGSAEIEGERFELSTLGWLEALRNELLEAPEDPSTRSDPAGLSGELRPYQREGLSWMERMVSLGLGGCLADDMGLGKTVMLIALHLSRSESGLGKGPTLVVCPTSILPNWEREVRRFAPDETVVRYHGPGRTLDGVNSGFVVTSYGTLRTDVDQLARINWGLIAADEAQHVKNHRTAAAKALRALPARSRVALTGTPIENRLLELWSILDWTTPGLLGGVTEFRRRWEGEGALADPAIAAELSALVGPFVLRRRKSDPGILPELPPKIEIEHAVNLTTEQVDLYEKVSAEMLREISSASGMARKGLVLELLTSLKQICNHPAHYLRQREPVLEGRSGKLDLFSDLVLTATEEGGRMLVFSQYVEMGRLLVRRLGELDIETEFLHGGTSVQSRERMVDRFQEGVFPVFVLSLKAGGQGLNLTAADHVLHYDRWWNPAVEDQATDRAHRIGQEGPVEVHRLIAEGTVEDRIAELHRQKRDLAEAVIGSGAEAFTELTQSELVEVLSLRKPDTSPSKAA